jgi:hypothetical protein
MNYGQPDGLIPEHSWRNHRTAPDRSPGTANSQARTNHLTRDIHEGDPQEARGEGDRP